MAIPRGILLRNGESMILVEPVLATAVPTENTSYKGNDCIDRTPTKSPISETPCGSPIREPFLCADCGKLLLRRDALKNIMTSGLSFARSFEYLKSGASFCCMCSIYYELIMQPQWKSLAQSESLVFSLRGTPKHKAGGRNSVFWISVNSAGPVEYWVTMINDDKGKPLCGYEELKKLELAAHLLTNCINNHTGCFGPTDHPLPTRVLDLGVRELGSDVRLFDGKRTRASYAALSYRWGVPQDQALSRSNLVQHYNRIQLSSLPRTIQEAIQVARALKMRYLWVDAYCIVQDCNQEKSQEVSNMHNIYQNSYFTVAAAGAPDATAGFLDMEVQSKSQKLPIMLWNGTIGTFSIRPSIRNLIVEQPLNTRAWALQECLLARRLLLFESGRAALELHCTTAQQDERGELQPISHYYSFDTRLLQNALRLSSNQTSGQNIPVHRLCNKWSAILENFCQRALTDPSDKLSALAGIATAFHNIWGGDYFAGIWGQFIFPQLLWSSNTYFSRPETYPRRPPNYRSPSWSWASIDGRIRMPPFPYLEPHDLEFISCNTTLADATCPFGPVTGGVLKLRGLVKEAFIEGDYLFDIGCTRRSKSQEVGFATLDMDLSNGFSRSEVWCLAVEKPHLRCEYDSESDTDSNFSQYSRDPPGDWGGLLLNRRDSASDEQTFVRIGVFRLSRHEWFDDCEPFPLTIV